MKHFTTILLLIVFLPVIAGAAEATKYTCPMHPHYIADRAGTCPICGMDLVLMEAEAEAAEPESGKAPEGRGKVLYYKHPMGKPETSPVPKKDEMGMDYIPVYEGDVAGGASVTIPPETIQNMGVRTVPAEMTVFGRSVRSFGAVTENTRLQSVVSARVEGWVEGLAVDAVGDAVRQGDVLFRLYSPDLVAAQRDFLAALRSGSAGRAASSARRLESLGVRKPTIETLRETRKAMDRVPVLVDHDGIVARLEVRDGAFVKPGATILVVQDYSSVWVTAAVAEKDLGQLAPGGRARLQFPSLPGREIEGKVDYVHPTVDPRSRTGQVRLVLQNPQGRLRPGAYADVTFEVEVQKRLAVPSEAILRDSRGAHVVTALGRGRFRPRPVRTGIVSDGRTEIISGLGVGENIVVSGQFLIDSESALRESLSKMQGTQNALAQIKLTDTELSLLDHFVDAALYVHESLTRDQDITPRYLDAALQAGAKLKPRLGATQLGPVVNDASEAVLAAQKARTQRELAGALADLVNSLKPWLTEGRPKHYQRKGVRLVAEPGSGRLWLQRGERIANPYGHRPREIPLSDGTEPDGRGEEGRKAPKGDRP